MSRRMFTISTRGIPDVALREAHTEEPKVILQAFINEGPENLKGREVRTILTFDQAKKLIKIVEEIMQSKRDTTITVL